MTEAELQAAIVETAKLFGWLVYHTRDARGSNPGFPDLTLVRTPRIIFAELKTTAGRLSPDQLRWQDALTAVSTSVASVLLPDCSVEFIAYRLWRPEHWRAGDVDAELRPRAR